MQNLNMSENWKIDMLEYVHFFQGKKKKKNKIL